MQGFKIAAVLALCIAFTLPAFTGSPQAPVAPAGALDRKLVEDLAYANRILYDQGILDGFGHVSVRNGKDNHFLMSRSIAPGLVTPVDILEFDGMGEPVDARGRAVYLERFIHAAIYRARPDVIAIVHSHSAALIPFGVTGTILRPIDHMSAFLGSGAAMFEIRDAAGSTNLMITDNEVADALAKSLGNNSVVLMRGHGSTVVGNSIPQVVSRAIYSEMNAKIQTEAAKLGPITFLTPDEAVKAAQITDSAALISRSWELWKGRIGKIE